MRNRRHEKTQKNFMQNLQTTSATTGATSSTQCNGTSPLNCNVYFSLLYRYLKIILQDIVHCGEQLGNNNNNNI